MNASTLPQPAAQMRRTPANLFFLLCLLGVLIYGGSFAWYVLANFDLVNLVRDMNIDDAFYYFQTARNFAEGKFSTFDGGITRTNGYHPLWMLFITPFYWVLDPETALYRIAPCSKSLDSAFSPSAQSSCSTRRALLIHTGSLTGAAIPSRWTGRMRCPATQVPM